MRRGLATRLGLALALGLTALASPRAPAAVPAPVPAATPVRAVGEGEGVRARLAQPVVLRGQFEQSKRLEGFRQPLVSRGDFLLVRDRGVAWDTREPFASTTLLTRERLLTRLPDGSQRVLLDAAGSPGMAAVNALLLALVAGDLPALAERFALDETLAADGSWRLVLTPDEADFLHRHGAEIAGFIGHTSTWLGVSAMVMEAEVVWRKGQEAGLKQSGQASSLRGLVPSRLADARAAFLRAGGR